MSDRSSAWYAEPGNAERRRRRMRAYSRASVVLGRKFADERRAEYQKALADGLDPSHALARAFSVLRAAHHDEFRKLLEKEVEASEPTQGPPSVTP